jgi:hypothetical protein
MKRLILLASLFVCSIFAAACVAPPTNVATVNSNAANGATNTNANTAKPTAAAPTKESLLALENRAFEAWKTKDGKFFESFLTDNFQMFSPDGRVDKAASVKWISENKCEVKSYAISDGDMHAAGPDVAIHTFKASQDVTCEGKKDPANVWGATIFVRSGNEWKAVFHNTAPVGDPKAAPPAPPKVEKKEAPTATATDALTTELLAVEKKSWEAWKAGDPKPIEESLSSQFVSISSQGRKNKADTIKMWFEPKCEVKSYSLEQAKATLLSPTAALLTFRGNAEGKCGDQPLMNLWAATLFVKEGDKWSPVLYTDAM